MAVGPNMQWRIRPDGNNTNGGGFDATVSGAGTDYTDQAAAQLSVTDAVTNGTSTITSATGGFTSNHIGNVARVGSKGYFTVTACIDTNTITVNGSPSSGTGLTLKIGGAFAGIENFVTGGSISMPSLASPLAPGHKVRVRGSGSDNPTTVDYNYTGYWFGTSGDPTTDGLINWIGYNGRPMIGFSGLWMYNAAHNDFDNFIFKANAETYANYGVVYLGCSFRNCKFDQDGWPVKIVGAISSMICCEITSSQAARNGNPAPSEACHADMYPGTVIGCKFSGLIGGAIRTFNARPFTIRDCIIENCTGNGISLEADYACSVTNCTINDVGGHGIVFANKQTFARSNILSNIFSNNTGSGKYAIATAFSSTTEATRYAAGRLNFNVYYNNTHHLQNLSYGSDDLVDEDPDYVGGADFTPQNPNLAGIACPPTLFGSTNNLWPGAIQPEGAGGGGGTTVIVVEDE